MQTALLLAMARGGADGAVDVKRQEVNAADLAAVASQVGADGSADARQFAGAVAARRDSAGE